MLSRLDVYPGIVKCCRKSIPQVMSVDIKDFIAFRSPSYVPSPHVCFAKRRRPVCGMLTHRVKPSERGKRCIGGGAEGAEGTGRSDSGDTGSVGGHGAGGAYIQRTGGGRDGTARGVHEALQAWRRAGGSGDIPISGAY